MAMIEVKLSEKDVLLEEVESGWRYRLNDVTVENIPSKEEALASAAKNLTKMIKKFLK